MSGPIGSVIASVRLSINVFSLAPRFPSLDGDAVVRLTDQRSICINLCTNRAARQAGAAKSMSAVSSKTALPLPHS